MAESPPSDCLIGRCGGEGARRDGQGLMGRSSMGRSSPKTPSHPSNGYAVMEDESSSDGLQFQPAPSSVRRSPRKHRSSCSHGMQVGLANNNYASSSLDDVHEDLSTDRPYRKGYDSVADSEEEDEHQFVVAVVSQEEDLTSSDSAVVATIASEKDANNAPPQPKQRRRRKSAAKSSKSTRRRSLRLQEKVAEPLTPDKTPMNDDSDVTAGLVANASKSASMSEEEDDLNLSIIDERNAFSKSSSRRQSLRIKKKVRESPSPAVAVTKKSPTKRRLGLVDGTKTNTGDRLASAVEHSARNDEKDDGDALPTPKKLCLGGKQERVDSADKDAAMLPPMKLCLEEKEASSNLFEITENGKLLLCHALQKIAFDAVLKPLTFDNVSDRKSMRRSKKHSRRGQASVLESLDDSAKAVVALPSAGKENVLNGSGIKKAWPRNRRDTFDLSKARGLTSSAKRMELNVFIDEDMSQDDDGLDYVTPKAGKTEVNMNAIMNEISSTLDNEPNKCHGRHGSDGVREEFTNEYLAVKEKLSDLTSNSINEMMRNLFPKQMGQVYNYPCVSARIFAAMNIVYEDQTNFAPLLPFLLSMVDAEIVSLKTEKEDEVHFINKKVCFSGFDYSSTTTAVGAVVGQGGGDLKPSIEALEAILQQALKLPRPQHYLSVAISCLQCMASCGEASNACAKTIFGYFPSARFERALKHYENELKDILKWVLAQHNSQASDDHLGVRYRMNDFIGRSVRYHLRELLNTIPESVVDFDVDDCEERWGRAVDDRSISSVLNFSLEKIHELITFQPELFEFGDQTMPDFFVSQVSRDINSFSRDDLKRMDKSTYDELVADITEARSFLFGARACKFVLELLNCPGVEEHINASGGWGTIEGLTSTFYKLKLYEGSENAHFVQLREVRDLIFLLEDVVARFEETVVRCEYCIRMLRRKFNFKSRNALLHNLKVHLGGEKGEYFPLVVAPGEERLRISFK